MNAAPSSGQAQPSAHHARSLSRSIFATVLVFTLLAVLATAIALVTVAYFSEEERSEEVLVAQARSCAQVLDARPVDQRIAILEEQFAGPERFTLIDFAGRVVFDTAVRDGELDNHYERPEMLAAEHSGEGVLVRHSDTMNQDILYVAERLSDGYFVRVSEERLSLLAFLRSMALPVGITLVAAVLLVIVLSRFLTARIMRPLDRLDVNSPLSGEAYDEMRPLLLRINEQQEQLKRQNEELKEAEGLRREFSANVSHEMKTPLQVISGSAEMIASGLVDPADIQDFGNRIYLESQRLRALINDVLTLSRLDESSFGSAEKVPVDMLELVRRSCERLAPLAREHQVEISYGGECLHAVGNEPLLEQAVSNLIENAIRYSEDGGMVDVRVESIDTPDGPQLAVRVRDEGIGISADDCEKIFERFYRTEKSRSKETGGTGLGLAIVKHAALYHGGDVSVESTLGEGSIFTLRLPLEPSGR